MQRELDPQLFQTSEPREVPANQQPGFAARPKESSFSNLDAKDVKSALVNQHGKIQELQSRIQGAELSMKEFVQQSQLRIERINQSFQRLEKAHEQFHQEASHRFATLQSRVNERRVSENKIEELFERQNSVLQNYENRLASLQKLVSDKEMQLINYASALKEMRQEMAKLKARQGV